MEYLIAIEDHRLSHNNTLLFFYIVTKYEFNLSEVSDLMKMLKLLWLSV